MRVGLAILVAAGCGRIGFDPGSGTGDGGVDRDGVYDDGFVPPACSVGAETNIAAGTGMAADADALWNGSVLGLAWDEQMGEYEVMFTLADARGVPTGSTANISNFVEHSWFPDLAWSGTDFAVAWSDDRSGNVDVRFARINATSGQRIGADLLLSAGTGDGWLPRLTWAGNRYELAWADDSLDNYEIWHAAVSTTGTVAMPPTRATMSGGGSWWPVVAWTGSELVTAWAEDAPVGQIFMRFVTSGMDSGPIMVTTSPGLAQTPSIVWTGSDIAMAWRDTRDGAPDVYVARFDTAGQRLTAEHKVSQGGTAVEPQLALAGDGFGVVWTDSRSGVEQVYFALLDADGARIRGEVPVTTEPAASDLPDVVWTGSQFVVVYDGLRGGRTDTDIFTVPVCAPL